MSAGPGGAVSSSPPEEPLEIVMIGQRGIPATHGGVERVVQEISTRMAERGHRVTVLCRSHYTPPMEEFEGVRIVRLPTIRRRALEMIVHSFLGAVWCASHQADVVHFQSVNPALMSPLVAWRHPVVATSHGRAYVRDGWSRPMRWMSRNAERVFCRVPRIRTAVSATLAEHYLSSCGTPVAFIPNGVNRPAVVGPGPLVGLGVQPGGYVLFVGRIEPAKGVHLLVDAFTALDSGLKLAIVGDPPNDSEYYGDLCAAAGPEVVFLGFRNGIELASLYEHCRLFAMPSFAEGQSLVLMEAMAAGCRIVYSDLPENSALMGPVGTDFVSGSADDMRRAMAEALAGGGDDPAGVSEVLDPHDWDAIVNQYVACYHEAIAGARAKSGPR